jgi:hypothetical protein
MKRGLGWLEDKPDISDVPISLAVGPMGKVRRYLAVAPSLMHLRETRLYQGPYGACVAFTQVRMIHMSLVLQGVAGAPIPSPKYAYYIGRKQEHAGMDPDTCPPLVDKGMYPRLAFEATKKLGFIPWDDSPYGAPLGLHDPDTAATTDIDTKPSLLVSRDAFDQSGLEWFVLAQSGARRSEVTADCLSSGIPVGFGMDVDTAFLHYKGSEPIKDINPAMIEGGHMMAVLEVLPNGDVVVDNWWEDWGFNDGIGILSAELYGSPWVRNVYGLRACPDYAW